MAAPTLLNEYSSLPAVSGKGLETAKRLFVELAIGVRGRKMR